MAITRIKNNQITDSSAGNLYLGINAAVKLQDYTITSAKISNNLVYGSDLTVTGNLTVQGNTTTIDTTNLVVEDPLIILASDQTGSPSLDIGYIGHRGTEDNIAFIWDESADEFATIFTTDLVTNTTVTINAYASLHTLDLDVDGNIDIGGNISITGNIVGNITIEGNLSAGNISAVEAITAGTTIDATGNITGGNIITGGAVDATGNVSGGNLVTAGSMDATGNITGGNISTAGSVDATGNVSGGNITTAGSVDATGNVSGGNLTTAGSVDAIGNITGGNISTTGTVSAGNLSVSGNIDGGNVNATSAITAGTTIDATGNITGGNLVTAGTVSTATVDATGNITGGNISTAGSVDALGNITGGNISTAGSVDATGNVSGANITTAGDVSASTGTFTGNVSADTFLGNIDGATGTFTGNVSADTFLGNIDGATGTFTGNVSADTFLGNISGETGTFTGNVDMANSFVTGNVTAGNLISIGAVIGNIEITGNITVENINATGNIIGANLISNGAVSGASGDFTGNVTVGNLSSNNEINATTITASGNLVGGNAVITNEVSAASATFSGNIIAGNVNSNNDVTAINVIASGNVDGANINTDSIVGTNIIITAGNVDMQLTGNLNLSDRWINAVADPVQAKDAATKQYVDDSVSSGIHIHTPVDVETPVALPAATYANGGATFTVNQTIAGNTVVFTTAANLQVNDSLWFDNSFEGVVGNLAYFVVSTPNTSAAVLSTQYNGVPVSNITSNTGLSESVRVNSGVGATLTATANAALVVDGVSVSSGDRILVYQQAIGYENGVYVVTDAGNVSAPWILTRSSDADTYIPDDSFGLDQGSYFYVQSGDTGAGESYVKTAPAGPFIFGLANIVFTQFSASQVYSANAQAGIDLTGTVFSAKVDNDTTAFDGGGNIIVKAGANLVTPNIGDATGNSLTLSGNGLLSATTVTATGNITGGNLVSNNDVTTITITASGNVSAGNVSSSGEISATGNVSGGNITTAGEVVATGNVSGGNITTAGEVVATGNVSGGNITTAGSVDATGNVTAGNLVSIAAVVGVSASFTGNVDAGNLTLGSGNITGGNIEVVGNVTAANFIGNVSGNISAAGSNTNIQFNDDGVLGGTAGFTFDKTANLVTLTGNIDVANLNATGEVVATGNITGGNITTTGIANIATLEVTGNANVIGNISGGNIDTSGEIVATGNITGGNINTAGEVVATGNVSGGNLVSAGSVVATGNIDGGNVNATSAITAGTTIDAIGNITGANINTAGEVVATGNISGGNLVSANDVTTVTVTASGNVDGGNINTIGTVVATGNIDGGNVNAVSAITAGTTIDATGNITGGNLTTLGNVVGGNTIITGQSELGNIVISGDDITGTNGIVNINQSLQDVDFAVNGNTTANLLYVDAFTNSISIGSETQTTGAILALNSTNSLLVPVGNTTQRPPGVTGMTRFNTTLSQLEYYDGSNWVGASAQFTLIDSEVFNGDGSTLVFTLSTTQTSDDCIISINGIVQIPVTAYSVSGTTLTFTEAPEIGDTIEVRKLTTTVSVLSIGNSDESAQVEVDEGIANVNITGNLLPVANITYDLGSDTLRWNELYLAGNSIYLGNLILKNTSGNTLSFFGPDGTTPGSLSSDNVDTTTISNGASNVSVIASNGNVNVNVNGNGIVSFYSGGINNLQANGVGNIGAASSQFNTIFAKATSAQYADLAEMYEADAEYEPGTVLCFGGSKEVTLCSQADSTRVAGVVSTNPSYLMNSGQSGEYVAAVALTGRVPCRVTGTIRKGDLIVSTGDGRGRANNVARVGTVIGKALADFEGADGVIEVVVGRV